MTTSIECRNAEKSMLTFIPSRPPLVKSIDSRSATSRTASWVLTFLTVWCFLTAGLCLSPRAAQLSRATEQAAMADKAAQEDLFLSKPIEEIRPGERVLAHNPELTDADRQEAEPDPATWRLLELEATAKDGHQVHVRLLRPVSWIEENIGKNASELRLKLEEIEVDGYAALVSLSPCPPIAKGAGQVVTGTFRHESDHLVDIHVNGEPPITCTNGHPFWSEDRHEFVDAGDLKPNEHLRAVSGQLAMITSVTERVGSRPVFNLEVKGEHVYHIGGEGILVHNAAEPDRCGGGKNAQHANQKRREVAEARYKKAREEFEAAERTPNKTPEMKKANEALKRAMKKAKQDMDFTGENHSQRAK